MFFSNCTLRRILSRILGNEGLYEMGRDSPLIDRVIRKYMDVLVKEQDKIKALQLLEKSLLDDDELDYVFLSIYTFIIRFWSECLEE